MAAARAGSKSQMLTIDNAWNAVALEERLELLARIQAHGVVAGVITILVMGTIGYGFDQISLLLFGFGAMFFTVPMFMSRSWRRAKPALILAYLAVRTMARRYAYGYNITDLDIILVYRGTIKELYQDREVEELIRQRQVVDFDAAAEDVRKPVWICLLRGGVVMLGERPGGAKLEFITMITNDLIVRDPAPSESESTNGLVIEGVNLAKGRRVVVETRSPGAQYVFRRQLERLVSEYKPPVNLYRGAH